MKCTGQWKGNCGIKADDHKLVFKGAIENDCGAFTPGLREGKNLLRDMARKQVAQMGVAVVRANERAIVDDHGERRLELARHRHGEVIAARSEEHTSELQSLA